MSGVGQMAETDLVRRSPAAHSSTAHLTRQVRLVAQKTACKIVSHKGHLFFLEVVEFSGPLLGVEIELEETASPRVRSVGRRTTAGQ
mmetsp:Transcript_9031/g.23602  ORF Transcript_9031/g.23602 Transcript_9031/m.23602 type:complete len:87 (-) Transcript_9031:31-291(-)